MLRLIRNVNRPLLPLITLLLAGLLQPSAEGADFSKPAAGTFCEAGSTICRNRNEVQGLGAFQLGKALTCNSQIGLCWQRNPAGTVNWRATRELYGSTSTGSGWGDWRPNGNQPTMNWLGYCKLHQHQTIRYEGPCQFKETPQLASPGINTKTPNPKTLRIEMGENYMVSFIWDRDRYRLSNEAGGSSLSIKDQGSRGVYRWAGMELLSGRTREDVLPEFSDGPSEAEVFEPSTLRDENAR
ncbi:MAG: hypothetical protein R6W06_06995 [Prochlorococcaceae cyanobacterium]